VSIEVLVNNTELLKEFKTLKLIDPDYLFKGLNLYWISYYLGTSSQLLSLFVS
jgi:hypothetical protein